MAKRIFDICGAAFGLLALLPLGLLIGVLIKVADGGPVFYRQTRMGQFGKPFRIWKFRSMVVDAERMGTLVTGADDRRMTLVGRVLRKTKLDELPQLWNVLVGEMSFVGPRPEVPRYVNLYTPTQRDILNYKPGLTDLATLLFRHEEALLRGAEDVEGFYARYCLPRKIELNRQYAATATLLSDLGIILRTVCPDWLGVLAVYLVVLGLSFWCSLQLGVDWEATGNDAFLGAVPWILVPQLFCLAWQRQMRGLLSYFSVPELWDTTLALMGAFLMQVGLSCLRLNRARLSPSLLFLDLLLSLVLVCGLRIGLRWFRERAANPPRPRLPSRRVAIIGTGELAIRQALELIRRKGAGRQVVAFFDDNPRTWNKRPHDIPVVGMPECLTNQGWLEQVDEVIVALPEEDSVRAEELTELLSHWPVRVVRTADSEEAMDGRTLDFRWQPKDSETT